MAVQSEVSLDGEEYLQLHFLFHALALKLSSGSDAGRGFLDILGDLHVLGIILFLERHWLC